mmetsp:Transcript_41633/g.81866  ORF Transcript_41633/g.81866 Transcript_41633/m.81866 type:complete len:503 (-) Transcript_41633:175-1683(-)
MMRLPTIAILFFSREVASRHYPFRDIDNLESQDQESMSFNYDSGHPKMDFDKDYWENQDKEGRIMMEEQGLRNTIEEQSMSFKFQATPTPAPVVGIVDDSPFSFVFTDGNFDDAVESVFSFSFFEEEATFSFSTGEILDEARSPVASVRGVIGIDSSELPSAESNNQLREDIAAAVGVPPDAVRIEEVLVADSSSPVVEGAEVPRLRNRNRRHLSQQIVTYSWTTVFTITTTLVTTFSSCGCTNTATLAVYVTQVCSAPTFPPPCTTCNVGPVACQPKPPPPCYCCQYACTGAPEPPPPLPPPTSSPTEAPTPPPPPVINEAVALICPYPGGPEGAVSGFVKVEDTANAQGVKFSGRLVFPSLDYVSTEGLLVRVHAGTTCEDAEKIYGPFCPWRGRNSPGGPFGCAGSRRNNPWTTEVTVARAGGGQSGQASFFAKVVGRITGDTVQEARIPKPTFSVKGETQAYQLVGHAVVVTHVSDGTQSPRGETRLGCGILNLIPAS